MKGPSLRVALVLLYTPTICIKKVNISVEEHDGLFAGVHNHETRYSRYMLSYDNIIAYCIAISKQQNNSKTLLHLLMEGHCVSPTVLDVSALAHFPFFWSSSLCLSTLSTAG